MRYKKLIGSIVILSSVVLLAGCSSGGESKKNKTKKNATTEQVAKFGIPQEVASIDPAKATDKVSFGVLNQIYEGFYRMDKDNRPEPAGAKELAKVSDDGLTYTLILREEAKWSNGEPVLAKDYVYAWQRVVNPETASEYAYLIENVKNAKAISAGDKKPEELGIEAVSDHEIKITLDNAIPYFDSLLAFPTFFPLNQKAVEEFDKDFANSSEKTIYNGPFVLSEFDGPGSDIEWKYLKNKDYWDKENVKINEIQATVVKEGSTALNLYEDGQLDDVIVTGELAKQYREDPNFNGEKDGRVIYIEPNRESKKAPFDNLNFRKALYYSVDNKAIVDTILGDGSEPVTGIVPKTLAVNPETKKDFVEESGEYKTYDEKKAKEYLEKAKKELNTTEFSFDILTDDNESTKKLAEYLQGAFKDKLGVKTTVTPVTKPIRLERTTKGDFDMVVTGWGADYNDVSSFLDLFETGNSYNKGKYSNKNYDKLIQDAKVAHATDEKARWADYLAAEKILLEEDSAVIPVYQVVEGHLRNPNLTGYIAHSAGASYEYKYLEMKE
ncbi:MULTISPECIES: peptide ABC transporter substrate-binding protein [Vagococcus]|uniref:Oligopeptide ABC transporter, periplasmic oligopeptide-binding protein OppA (TC 3.A.1.5.1) n=1 Tax=Vagococcus fluvialis bH819 TaxID=1255619 RepID=A0A1X6WJQ9_9ENTE|nr:MULTISPECIES: peptide ABC transporter substrate-binding protein [Vagococcus]SLM84485.1 Oligopeptide ABC transporter, periplasmic oligopeptide-binding protein OppA (TC 3.A.1.5.1) [Vagococcus fluvialis bH819]HCM90523.1 peptide ABC transporter substrate-binding protein [Vagococcus sp.]